MSLKTRLIVTTFVVSTAGFPHALWAHCDTLKGPVVTAARLALQTNNVTPVLKWVKESDEAAINEAFRKTMNVRGLNLAVQELADRFFFETVVRLHRVGEGESYTGLKEQTGIDETVEGADKALNTGNIELIVKLVTDRAAVGVRERFARVRELRQHSAASVAAGRRYVEAYVDFIHYVEELNAHSTLPAPEAHKSNGTMCVSMHQPT